MNKPESPQLKPYVMKIEPGNYAWCACGLSQKQPFCDGSHKPTAYKPVIEKVTETKNVAWCGCKMSSNPPFCDGTHSKL